MAAPALACVVPLVVRAQWPGLKLGPPQEQGERGDSPEISDTKVRLPGAHLELVDAPRDYVVGEELRPRQSPFLLARADGSTTLGYLEWSVTEGDRIVLCTPTPDQPDAGRRVVNEKAAEIIRPIGVVDARGRARLFWTELVDGLPQLRSAVEPSEAGAKFAEPVTLTSGAPHMNVEATLHQNRGDGGDAQVWVAWESETPPAADHARGSRDVYVAPFGDDGRLGAPIRVGDGAFSDLDPGIVSSGGRLWIVWVGYSDRDYEVRLRSLDPKSGLLSPVIEVSADSASDDLHPSLVAAKSGDLWIAWDRIENPTRGESAPPGLRLKPREDLLDISVRVACVRDGKVLLPESPWKDVPNGSAPGAPLLSEGGGVPRLCIDAAQRIWIAYRYLAHSSSGVRGQEGYPLLVQRLDTGGFAAPLEIAGSVGFAEEPAIVPVGTGISVAFQCDRRFEKEVRADRLHVPPQIASPLSARGVRLMRWYGTTGIGMAHAESPMPGGDAPGASTLTKLVDAVASVDEPHFHPFAGRLADPIVTGARHFEIARGGTSPDQWQVFWGDLHRHSNVSRCSRGMEPGPADRWEWGRDIHLYDFMALTDHSGQLAPFSWWQLDKLCWLYQSPTFCTLSGWEWSTTEFGHHNVILPGRMTPLIGDDDSIDLLYKRLRPGECVTIPHHSSDVNFPNDFAAVQDRFTRLIEVFQARRGSFEFDGCFKQSPAAGVLGSFVQDALNAGHKFGIIASPDHGDGQSYACVLAKSLDRASLFEALLNRRTYGATTKGMLIDLRVDDAVMGEEVECAAPPRVRLHALGTAELAEVVVFRGGRIWKSSGRERGGELNGFAPVRLVVRFPIRGGGADRVWTLKVRAPKASFDMLVDRRPFTLRRNAPSWSFSTAEATLTCPRSFAATAAGSTYALHVRAGADVPFVFSTELGETRATFAELRKEPLAIETPGGPCTIAIELGDAVVDLETGLGTTDFTGEWEDHELKPGDAWYYARVIQTDGEMAWSSPIFVRRS